ncbi:3-hydroxyacyl-CoA dehydrogenase family protein [Geobacter sp. AOG1]|uniref:3-hydroxyacyl-CoA dehydrogenase family protein n=1 Tax=Geobacter sp. AOG1 TaxID=1566346 RepID=UPI001CC3F7BE|nr:3-hydroxyacyl-CoA dehydrogenase NAD-binding domain-containing protein [Geobacter sp. AOG1]GFE58633.1 3-hydroxybutyryl-CoA dehydrogenase [Geobacter sp. AOG1]
MSDTGITENDMLIHKLGVLGSGTMGKQIALLCASHGYPVIIWNHIARDNFFQDLEKLCLLQARLGLIQKDAISPIMSLISYTSDITQLCDCDFIIETVKESSSVKTSVLQMLGNIVTENTIFATNSSTFSTTELASITKNPQQFIGIHFFNPPMSMKLIEVIKGELTNDYTVSKALDLLSRLEKHPVVLPETPGFVVNRLLFPMINEAIFLLSEGIADEKTIDSCMKMGANHPMGPLELADFIGLDVCLSILETLVHETGDAKYRPAHLLKKYVRAGKLGKKAGIGFYTYRKKG